MRRCESFLVESKSLVAVRKVKKSWQYDFRVPGDPNRYRRTGFRTKAEALAAEKRDREKITSGHRRVTFAEAYDEYNKATALKERTKDTNETLWSRIEEVLGHFYVEDIDTKALDDFKCTLPDKLSPKSVNNHLALVKRFCVFLGHVKI